MSLTDKTQWRFCANFASLFVNILNFLGFCNSLLGLPLLCHLTSYNNAHCEMLQPHKVNALPECLHAGNDAAYLRRRTLHFLRHGFANVLDLIDNGRNILLYHHRTGGPRDFQFVCHGPLDCVLRQIALTRTAILNCAAPHFCVYCIHIKEV
jgi:hypothetical protein